MFHFSFKVSNDDKALFAQVHIKTVIVGAAVRGLLCSGTMILQKKILSNKK